MRKLPIKLEREPLVDAAFEVRFLNAPPLEDLVPGFLLGDKGAAVEVSRLPAAEIPYPIRQQDPNLRNTPTQRISYKGYSILVGHQNIVVSCALPYPKWAAFKDVILDVMESIAKMDIAGSVERYSLKYVNLLQAPGYAEQIDKVDMSIRLGELNLGEEHVSLQAHKRDGDVVHLLSIITGANGELSGEPVSGVLVDIDSICDKGFATVPEFRDDLERDLESLRQSNKQMFFNCLKANTISEMGPTYE